MEWIRGQIIGQGSSATVCLAGTTTSAAVCAVKSAELSQSQHLQREQKILSSLSSPHIVTYKGFDITKEKSKLMFNLFMEYMPHGTLSSHGGRLLEPAIAHYTKQVLKGLEYLHSRELVHCDIKGSNILVGEGNCVKIADFGLAKSLNESAGVPLAGTPAFMSPEAARGEEQGYPCDVWGIGCTVIEMATGKPPWSQQYQQEVAALFHIGTTKSHPPIPDHLSVAAKDFLLKCLQKEPYLRPSASELLQHPFVTGEPMDSLPVSSTVVKKLETSSSCAPNVESFLRCSNLNLEDSGNKELWGISNDDDDMCMIDDDEEFSQNDVKQEPLISENIESFNPMSDPSDDWVCKFDGSPELEHKGVSFGTDENDKSLGHLGDYNKEQKDFSFPSVPSLSEEDDELTESKIQAFLDEKALELKKLQTPLYEEFYNSLNISCSPSVIDGTSDEAASRKFLKLPPKSKSPSRIPSTPSKAADNTGSPGSNGRSSSTVGNVNDHSSQDLPSSPLNEFKGLIVDSQQEPGSPSLSFSKQREWKEELDQELERKREWRRQAGVGSKTSSPKDRALHRQRERTRFASPSK